MVGGREKRSFLREGGIWLLDRHLDLGYMLWNFTNRFFLVLKNYCLFRLKCSSSIRFIHVTAFLDEKLSDVSKNASDYMSPNCCCCMWGMVPSVSQYPFAVLLVLRGQWCLEVYRWIIWLLTPNLHLYFMRFSLFRCGDLLLQHLVPL